jgi:hypothetical protein
MRKYLKGAEKWEAARPGVTVKNLRNKSSKNALRPTIIMRLPENMAFHQLQYIPNVIKLTTRFVVHIMHPFIDFVLSSKFSAWSNRFGNGTKKSMQLLYYLQQHIFRSLKK